MDLLLFCTVFILQFVGHRVGDYVFQTDWQAQNKAKNIEARGMHCAVYATVIALILYPTIGLTAAIIVQLLTFMEHIWIDSRKPVIAWKTFLEERIAGRTDFDINQLPFFVLIEIDQTFHYVRILLISILIGYGII